MNKLLSVSLLAGVALMALSLVAFMDRASVPVVSADANVVIDFEEGLTGGDFVNSLNCTLGIDCDGAAIPGSVAVLGHNPAWAGDPNSAMIFNSGVPTCGDTDLGTPNQAFGGLGEGAGGAGGEFANTEALGNLLIVQEDPTRTNCQPDDADIAGAFLQFDFSGFGPGVVTVNSLYVIDIELAQGELPATVQVFSGGCATDEVGAIDLPSTGDNGVAQVAVGLSGDCMRINLRGSGGFTNISLTIEEEDNGNGGGEGCTPGYWRQPHHFDSWPNPFSPNDSFQDVFGVEITVGAGGQGTITDPTLLEALVATAGGDSALARHAVAGLLNAASPDVDYTYSVSEVIDMVNDAYTNPATSVEDVKDDLEAQNELGCPLD